MGELINYEILSFFSPAVDLTVLANLNQKLKLLFSAEVTQMKFSASAGRRLESDKIQSTKYCKKVSSIIQRM